MLRYTRTLAVLCLLSHGCGKGSKSTDGNATLVALYPADGAELIPISARVTATLSREAAQTCRFSPDNTTMTVTRDATPVDGALVFFVDGLRVDFTAAGLLDYGASYKVDVTLACSSSASATFATAPQPTEVTDLAVGDSFRIMDLAVSEPGPIAPLLKEFLGDAELVVQVLEVGTDTLRLLGGEGKAAGDEPSVRVFRNNAFLFPMLGTYRAPYFQVQGSIEVPVDEDTSITLEYFEIAGRFIGSAPNIEIIEAAIRAQSSCATVCEVADGEIQLVCANPDTICDADGNLNLIGSYVGAPNALAAYQTIAVDPQAQVPTSATLSISLSKAVNATKERPVIVSLLDSVGSEVAVNEPLVSDDGLSATVAPMQTLLPGATYTLLVVAHKAEEVLLTTEEE